MTKRQAVLLVWLVTFCARCGSPDLPMKVDRVIGYGSFFRGEPNPDDVDLLAMVGRLHHGFERFRDLVEKDQKQGRRDAAPDERMRRLARQHPDPEVRRLADVYATWLEGLSDRWLYEQSTVIGNLLKISPFVYERRILHRGLPRIRAKVTNYEGEIGSVKVEHEIWTPDQADVKAVVERIWGADHRGELIREAEWFEEQSRPHLLQIAILDRVAARLRASRIRVDAASADAHDRQAVERFRAWLEHQDLGFPAELCVRATQEILDDDADDAMPEPPGYGPPDFASLETTDLARVVEEKRQSLWELRRRVYVLRLVVICLAMSCFRDKRRCGGRRGWHIVGEASEAILRRDIPPDKAMEMLDAEVERLGLW